MLTFANLRITFVSSSIRQARKKEFWVSIKVTSDKNISAKNGKSNKHTKPVGCVGKGMKITSVDICIQVLRHSAASPGHQIQCSHHTRIRSGAIAACHGRSAGGVGDSGSSASIIGWGIRFKLQMPSRGRVVKWRLLIGRNLSATHILLPQLSYLNVIERKYKC